MEKETGKIDFILFVSERVPYLIFKASVKIGTNIYKRNSAKESMSFSEDEPKYIRPEQRIYEVATDKNVLDWRGFLYELIHKEGLDPWNIDVSVLTKTYVEALRSLQQVDFDVSGKLLTIAVFLLRTKTQHLVEKDIRGIEEEIERAREQQGEEGMDLFDENSFLDDIEQEAIKQPQKYEIKLRNPLARKRKVTIFDLIRTLEKTFDQSNKRRANVLQRKRMLRYEGPMFDKKPKDLKVIIEELFNEVLAHIRSSEKIAFSYLTQDAKTNLDILEKFLPLLHLVNQERIQVSQDEHFAEIYITPLLTNN